MKPLYDHDCEVCQYLGTYTWQEKAYDLYTCKQGRSWPTVIARYASEGSSYVSGLEEAKHLVNAADQADRDQPLAEALRRARDRGLLSKKDLFP